VILDYLYTVLVGKRNCERKVSQNAMQFQLPALVEHRLGNKLDYTVNRLHEDVIDHRSYTHNVRGEKLL